MMVRPELSDSIAQMILRDDESHETAAEEWIRTYDDLDALVAPCHDDDLWLLARAMTKDALMSGSGDLDVGEIMDALVKASV